jgi:hypothetical protein
VVDVGQRVRVTLNHKGDWQSGTVTALSRTTSMVQVRLDTEQNKPEGADTWWYPPSVITPYR